MVAGFKGFWTWWFFLVLNCTVLTNSLHNLTWPSLKHLLTDWWSAMSWCSMILPGNVGHWRIKRFQEGFPGFHLISSRIFEVFWDPSVKVTEMEILNPDQLGLVGCLRAMGEPTQDRDKSIKRKLTEMYKPRSDIHPSFSYVDQYWFSHAMNCEFCIKSAQAKAKNSGCVPRTWFWSAECCWIRRPIWLFDVIWGFVVRLKISGNGGRGDQQAQ